MGSRVKTCAKQSREGTVALWRGFSAVVLRQGRVEADANDRPPSHVASRSHEALAELTRVVTISPQFRSLN